MAGWWRDGWHVATVVSTGVATAAIAVAGWALAVVPDTDEHTTASTSRAHDTANVCAVFDLAYRSVSTQTNLGVPAGAAGQLAAAANARLALVAAAQTLWRATSSSTAAPAEVLRAADELADQYSAVGMNYLAGAPRDQEPVPTALQKAGEASAVLTRMCN